MAFHNTYQDAIRASAYDELEYGGTYHLVFRELPELLRQHVTGRRAVDFGCGTGRSSRFLKSLDFDVTGIDVSSKMVAHARKRDSDGDYRVIKDGEFGLLPQHYFDLVLSAFTFDNIPSFTHKLDLFKGLGHLLKPGGVLVNVVSTPDIYTREWVTFSTRNYPENRRAKSGDSVWIVTTQYSDARPVEDILCTHEDYLTLFTLAGFDHQHTARPLAHGDEGIDWINETEIAPWAIYVISRPVQ